MANDFKNNLLGKLKEQHAFWSYKEVREIDDVTLIEKVMLFLDIDDIKILFSNYNKEFIRQVWEQNILNQEPYYHGLNRFFAWFYFGIENPDDYIVNFIQKRDEKFKN